MSRSAVETQGLETRRIAATLLRTCIARKLTVEEALAGSEAAAALSSRDRAFLSTLLLTSFRHRGEIESILARFLDKPLPRKSGATRDILAIAVTQLLFLQIAPHAVIDIAVRSAKADRNAVHFSGLVNAVLRKAVSSGETLLEGLDSPRLNTPDWLWARWSKSYGEPLARRIAESHTQRPGLDLSFKGDSSPWREALGADPLPNGQLRLKPGHPPVSELPGFQEGAWWVQDAAATIPARLLGDVAGTHILDLCAAPGGKTMQLAAAGAQVTAIDISEQRSRRLRDNLARLGLSADIRTQDVLSEDLSGSWDGVLLDAPCSSTGTIRRHPELPYLKEERQVLELAGLQRRMLRHAAKLVKPGGTLVYCSCSLEPEEGESQVRSFLRQNDQFEILPAAGAAIPEEAQCAEGWVRTLPFMGFDGSPGMDGFFAAALRRRG